MVDADRRRKLATKLKTFLAGGSTTEELLEDDSYWRSKDRGLAAVFRRLWLTFESTCYTSDDEEFKKLDAREEIERVVLFLDSQLEYQWRDREILGVPVPVFYVLHVLTFGYYGRQCQKREEALGDVDAWPFIRKADMELVRARHSELPAEREL
jgi:hypothetical protein